MPIWGVKAGILEKCQYVSLGVVNKTREGNRLCHLDVNSMDCVDDRAGRQQPTATTAHPVLVILRALLGRFLLRLLPRDLRQFRLERGFVLIAPEFTGHLHEPFGLGFAV